MKNALFVFVLSLLSLTGIAQKNKKAKKLTDFSITQTKLVKPKGTQLVVKQVISDARCPVGVDCVWAGCCG